MLLIDWSLQIVAKRRAESELVALLDLDAVHHRRPHALGLDGKELHQRLCLGLETLHRAFGFGERLARAFERLAGVDVGALRGDGSLAGVRHGGHGGLSRGGHRIEVGTALGGGGKPRFEAIAHRQDGLSQPLGAELALG